jgi:hypothetical protein
MDLIIRKGIKKGIKELGKSWNPMGIDWRLLPTI